MVDNLELKRRFRAAGVHALVCAAIATLAGVLVFGLWFPGVYRSASGGRDLFLLVTGVDVVLGPLLTFAVFNLAKGWKQLRRDLAVIGAIQLAALAYGLHTVYLVRPVAMVFEADRFRVVTAADVYRPELPKAPPEYRSLPVSGPWLLGTRAPQPGKEHGEALFMALQGADIADRPAFWQHYAKSAGDALGRARPLSALLDHYPSRDAEIKAELGAMGADLSTARFLPLVARSDWVVVLDGGSGSILGYVQANGFF